MRKKDLEKLELDVAREEDPEVAERLKAVLENAKAGCKRVTKGEGNDNGKGGRRRLQCRSQSGKPSKTRLRTQALARITREEFNEVISDALALNHLVESKMAEIQAEQAEERASIEDEEE